MPEDRTLDAFVTEEAEADSEASDGPDDGEGDDRPVPPTEVAPMQPTATYAPTGEACAACGATVDRRFRSPEGFCCVDCVAWSDGLED